MRIIFRSITYAYVFLFGPRNSTDQRQKIVALAVLAGVASLSFLFYWLAFVRPYNLLELYHRPRLSLYILSKTNPIVHWELVAAFLVQGGLYWLGWRAALKAHGRAAWFIVLGGALAFSAVLLFLYPFDAADIFDNIMHGRILGIYGANPFRQVAAQFKIDPFYPYMAWRNSPSAYGPIWETLAGGMAQLAGDGIIANVLAFKLLGGVFLAISIGLVAVILRRQAPERALAGVVLLAWNPVVLYETIGNGHNDIAMAVWILAAAWAFLYHRYTLAILALWVGALIKFIPVLLLPVAGMITLRDLPDTRSRLRFVMVTALSAVALTVISYGPFWYGLESLSIGRRARLFTASLPATVYAWLWPIWGKEQAGFVVTVIAASLTVLFVLWQSRRTWLNHSWLNFTQATFNILIFYLLVTCLWFQQWYAVWVVAVAALLPPGHAARLAVLFSYAAMSKLLIFGPMLWVRPFPPISWIELRFGPAVLAIPWLYALFALWRSRQIKRETRNVMRPPIGGLRL